MIGALSLFLALSSHGSFVVAVPSLWDISIDKSPAPPPDKGPPLSAAANRDPSTLKYELIGIAGAYVLWIAVTIVLIVIVRSRLRRKSHLPAQSMRMTDLKSRPRVELREIPTGAQDRSPLSPKSPGKMASLKSWARGHKAKDSDATISTVDTRVVEQDRARNMDEMTKLYAAVMAQDDLRSQKAPSSPSSNSSPISDGPSPITPRSPLLGPPEFQHLRQPLSHPLAPTPVEQPYQRTIASQYEDDEHLRPTPSSFTSAGTTRVDSADTTRSRNSRKSIRGQRISGPVGKADLRLSVGSGHPQSPRLYNPGPPPPTPGKSQEVERRGPPPSLSLDNAGVSSMTSSTSLPFRQFYADSLRSAPATRTTFVERRQQSTAPRTAVPHTPYSPYTPFTPITPVTPGHLPTKQELKQNRKKNALRTLAEDGMVKSDTDMWGTE